MKFQAITKDSKEFTRLLNLLKTQWAEAVEWFCDIEGGWKTEDLPQIVVAIQDGEIVGEYSLVRHELLKDNFGFTPWIGTLFVAEKYRGQGYSKKLLLNTFEKIQKMGFDEVFLATDLENFYEKFGFEFVKTGVFDWGKETKIYRKKLK
ncbi:MAG: GNAT family N-acetyltransferase [Alphaproteobacteria bacterium]|nr:GNAT family N-acetyltransferase [Alphaproteobacteria bacterium]